MVYLRSTSPLRAATTSSADGGAAMATATPRGPDKQAAVQEKIRYEFPLVYHAPGLLARALKAAPCQT